MADCYCSPYWGIKRKRIVDIFYYSALYKSRVTWLIVGCMNAVNGIYSIQWHSQTFELFYETNGTGNRYSAEHSTLTSQLQNYLQEMHPLNSAIFLSSHYLEPLSRLLANRIFHGMQSPNMCSARQHLLTHHLPVNGASAASIVSKSINRISAISDCISIISALPANDGWL